MLRFEEELNQAGVDPDELSPPGSTHESVHSDRPPVDSVSVDAWTSVDRHNHTLSRLQTRRLPGDKALARLRRRDLNDQDHLRDAAVSINLDCPHCSWIHVLRLAGRVAGACGDSVLRLCGDYFLRRVGQIDCRSACIDVFPGAKTIFRQAIGGTKRDSR